MSKPVSLFLVFFIFFVSCSSKNEIKFHEACSLTMNEGVEILVCDETRMKKVKSINSIYRDCEKFAYVLIADDKNKEYEGIKCKTSHGYEVIK